MTYLNTKRDTAASLVPLLAEIRENYAAVLPDSNDMLEDDLMRLPARTLNGLLDALGMVRDKGWPHKHEENGSYLGQKIVAVRSMSKAEARAQGWERLTGSAGWPPPVLELGNGAKLYPAKDYEGNGFGAIFGEDDEGSFTVKAPESKVEAV